MVLIRCLAMLLIAALLSGGACTPVHSDRPLGSQPYAGPGGRDAGSANQLNGLWAIHIPAGARVGAPHRYLAWYQPELDRFVVLSAADAEDATVGELPLRTHRVGGEEWFFLNEEDRRLKGFFLWTLARQVNADTFLIWTTVPRVVNFQMLVDGGQLPGTVLQDLKDKSVFHSLKGDDGLSASGLPVAYTLLLQGLEPRHLDFIIEHRADLFQMDNPLVLRRVDKFPALKHPDVWAIRTPPAPPASAASAGAP